MKIQEIFLLITIISFSCQLFFAQTPETASSITIKIKNGKYILSGFVSDDSLRNEIVNKVSTEFGNNANFSQLKVRTSAKPFNFGWQKDFEKSIAKIRNWKTGILVFSSNQNKANNSYPDVPKDILNAELFFIDKKEPVRLSDYRNKVVILFLLASWCGPCMEQADEMKKINAEISSSNLQIIGLSTEDSTEEKRGLLSFAKRHKLNFPLGWADAKFLTSALKISKFNGIPQTFVINNGRLENVYVGGGVKTLNLLKENIAKILEINNLK